MSNRTILKILVQNDLKVTPQRVAILEAIMALDNHPSVDDIADLLRLPHPNISLTTIYKNLDTFIKKGIVDKVLSENTEARYEVSKEKHHHLYSPESERIEDYYDEDLNRILMAYFREKQIPGFSVAELKLQIIGKFNNENPG